LSFATISWGFAGAGAQAATKPQPIHTVAIAPQVVHASAVGVVTQLAHRQEVSPFTMIALTWNGHIDPTAQFRVRVREAGQWSTWTSLGVSEDFSTESASSTQAGTDPLLTAQADAISVKMLSKSGKLPSGLRIVTADAVPTARDAEAISIPSRSRSAVAVPQQVVSTRGALVARPQFVTRTAWGADESLRTDDPVIASGIVAGFIHHTATTNRYSASQGPAQMRNLYAYFTGTLGYRDMGYSFLVDKYGNVYEGRSGCPRDPALAASCDGPSQPAVGGHTSGLNTRTFAVSVIGNYHVAKPTPAQANLIVNALAKTFAWKFAPYGVDPLGTVTMVAGKDNKGSARFPEGTSINIATISGHRDVGQTVCPGKYLYPYLPLVRQRVAALLTPSITGVTSSTESLLATDATPITLGMTVPAASDWSIDVLDAQGTVVWHNAGTTTETEQVAVDWTHVGSGSALLPEGVYTARFAITHGASVLPTIDRSLALASIPNSPLHLSATRLSSTKVRVSWDAVSNAAQVSYAYRVTDATTGISRPWSISPNRSNAVRIKGLIPGHRYSIAVKATNALGSSEVALVVFKHK
jgi:hypothetical protein